MEENLTPKHAQRSNPYAKARKILDLMSRYRIDPRRIKTIDSGPSAKGGQGTVVVGTIMPGEGISTRRPEPLSKERLDKIFELNGAMRNFEKADEEVESLKALVETASAAIVGVPDREDLHTWFRNEVFRKLPDTKYAIKKLKWDHEDAEASVKLFKSFVNELSLMAELSHPNIIQLVGFVEDIKNYDARIVLPWEANGNVREFLQSGEWDIPERISLIHDVAKGVEYLHTREPPICHGDLKSLNILVKSSNHAVITDFGSARRVANADAKDQTASEEPPQAANDDTDQRLKAPRVEFHRSTLELTLTGSLFTLRWAAPEVLADEAKGLPSDMWAVGWICWEIITGKIPFEELSEGANVVAWVVKGKLPAIREQAQLSLVLKLCTLMSDCWKRNPAERIDASDFRRRVHMMPSIAPSDCAAGGSKIRSADLLLQLGRIYALQSNGAMAKTHYESALNVASQTNNERARAGALNDLGNLYSTESRDQEAEKALKEAHEIHARVGNELGAANALGGLGSIYAAQSRYQEAENALREAHEIDARNGNDLGKANTLNGLGAIYSAQSRDREAEKAFREAHEIHARIGNDLGAADALDGLGSIYAAQSRYQEAEKALREAHEIDARIGYDLGAANALIGLGHMYRAQSRNQEAEKALREAHEIDARIGNDLGAANALNGLGRIYSAQSRNQEADKAFREAHDIHARIGDDLGTASALLGLGQIYGAQSRDQEADKAFREAYDVYTRIGNDLGAANALNGLGNIYGTQSGSQEAEKALREAHEMHARIGNELGAAKALGGLGQVYLAQSKNLEAEAAFRQVHATSSRIGDLLGTGNSLLSLGFLFILQHRYEEAQSLLCDALISYSRAGSGFGRAQTLISLAFVYQTRGNDLQAEESVTEALTIGVQLKDDRIQPGGLAVLANLFSYHSKYSTTLAAPLQAGPASEPLVDDIRRASALHDTGKTLLTQSKYSEAAESYLQAGDIFSRIGDGQGEASMFRSLGTVSTLQGRFELAMKLFAEARRISADISDHNGEVRALECLMGACLQQPTLAGLRSYCVDALRIYGETQWSMNKEASASSMGQAQQAPAHVSDTSGSSTPSRSTKRKAASADDLDEETSARTPAAKKAKLAAM